ncbi:hypothetical protein DPMN_161502 [Dreissena polymorpha]|uniref:Uncharacterized protein n=1 Tax=Dreissena polymorpha TaxID=45954 RepID=A0A9D4IR57_DREPO|nr:hypothetical protein DPMN_161502 [Dreissena polymorpha]
MAEVVIFLKIATTTTAVDWPHPRATTVAATCSLNATNGQLAADERRSTTQSTDYSRVL